MRHSCTRSGLQRSEEPEDRKESQSSSDSREKAQYDQIVYGENGIDSSYHVHSLAETRCETRVRSLTPLLVSYGAVAAATSGPHAPACANGLLPIRIKLAIVDRIPSDRAKQTGIDGMESQDQYGR